MTDTSLQAFLNTMKRMRFIDRDMLEKWDLIPKGDSEAWGMFRRDPFRWLILADDETAARFWELFCRQSDTPNEMPAPSGKARLEDTARGGDIIGVILLNGDRVGLGDDNITSFEVFHEGGDLGKRGPHTYIRALAHGQYVFEVPKNHLQVVAYRVDPALLAQENEMHLPLPKADTKNDT